MVYQLPRSIEEIELVEQYWQAKSRESFWAFRQYMHPKMKVGWWQREVAKELSQFYYDFIGGHRPILLIQAPPQHGKSFQIIDFVAWLSGKNPDVKSIYASFSERLGIRGNLMLQRMFDSPKYKAVFPDTRISERNSVTISGQKLRNREILEYMDYEGYFRNTTVRGSITGEGLDLGILDDPIKGREEANSIAIRDKTWDWLTDDFMSRFSDEAGLLGIMTRWHVDDPFGRMIKNLGDKVKVRRYPAIAEHDEEHRKAGEPLFPEHKSLEFLLERKSAMHMANWEALYQQNPMIVGGGIIKDEWWRFHEVTPRIVHRLIYADTAQKTKEQNDYSVFQCWGMGRDGRIYLLDMIRGKWEAPELLTMTASFWNKHKAVKDQGTLRQMKIEDKSSGTGLIQQLKRGNIPITAIPRSIDKTSRALDVAPQIEAGNVSLPKDAPFTVDILTEASGFPNATHDDCLDPLFDAVNDMLINGNVVDYAKVI